MNAGAYDGEMSHVTVSADCLTKDGKAVTFTAEELALGYRHTALMERGDIVLGITLRLKRATGYKSPPV
jgi:UDP-N-acetylmuramate dehydrogenase